MKHRPDLLDEHSPAGLEVVQLTAAQDVPASHVYMEAQVFSPDSRRLILHRAATAHGGDWQDPRHRYLVCDLEDGCRLTPITEEPGAKAPSVAPDGRRVFYLVDETSPGRGRVTLKSVALDGTDRRTILVLDGPLLGTSLRASHLYPLSTISSDGERLAISAFLGDGRTEHADFGLLVFEFEAASVRLVLRGPDWCNMHPQYCRSVDPDACRDILVQQNHDCICDAGGRVQRLVGGAGADVHVIRDDGGDFRTMPWGRDGRERCQGHQCWRGRSVAAITSTSRPRQDGSRSAELIQGWAVPDGGHLGLGTPAARRSDLSRGFGEPGFCHFATDVAGRRLVSDCEPFQAGGRVFLAELPVADDTPIEKWTYLLSPRSSCRKEAHIHPFLSPDGSMAFFNSDEGGALQAYMVRGW
jgi:hypothetical protein